MFRFDFSSAEVFLLKENAKKDSKKFVSYRKRYYLCNPFALIWAFWWSGFGRTT